MAHRSFARTVLLALLLAAVAAPLAAQNTSRAKADAPSKAAPASAQILLRANAAFKAGVAAREKGDLEAAQKSFAEAARLAPQIPEAHQALGTLLVELKRYPEAIRELEKALALRPGSAEVESALGVAYSSNNDNPRAIAHFAAYRKLLAGHAADPLALHRYVVALSASGSNREALELLKAEAALAAPTAQLLDDRGSIEAQLADWPAAEQSFQQALNLDYSNLATRIHLAIVLRQEHRVTEAIDTLRAGERQQPNSPAILLELGRSYLAISDDSSALEALQRAHALTPDLAHLDEELATLLQRLGRQDEAIPYFRRAHQADPGNGSLANNFGLALALTGKATEALPLFDIALKATPKAAVVWEDKGVAHIQLSAFDDAIREFSTAVLLDPANPQLHYDLGLALKFKDRMPEAIVELKKAGEMDATLEDPPYTLGILLMQLGRLDEAVVELRKAAALRPQSGDIWAILGSTLKQADRLDEAREALEHAVPLLPGQPGPRITLAAVLSVEATRLAADSQAASAAGSTARAAELEARIRDLRAQAADYRRQGAELSRSAVNRQKSNFAMNAGNQLMLRGQISQAVDRYLEAIAADASFAEPHSQLALAYERLGRKDDATAERATANKLAGEGK